MILQKTAALGFIPKRIVSAVPSQTELLHYLELEDETVGITKFCVHPEIWFKTKTSVGGTKKINKKIIAQLRPDLIIANKEENDKEQIEQLALDYPVWITDITNFEGALQMIADIGALTGKGNIASTLIRQIENIFTGLPVIKDPVRTAYLIWRRPYMSVGGDTFINDMLQKCGFKNIFSGKTRYPETSIRELQIMNCQLLLLSSEPYPFKQKHIDELSYYLPQTKIILVDGEMFSWYGSRLLQSASYFKQLTDQIRGSCSI